MKEALDRFLGEQSRNHQGGGLEAAADLAMAPRERKVARVVDFFMAEMQAGGGQTYYTGSDLARHMDISAQEAGQLIRRVFPVENKRNKGYSAEQIFAHLERMEGAAPG